MCSLNQLACVYFETPADLAQAVHNEDFILIVNKFRCGVFFASENPHFEKSLLASPISKPDLKFLMLTSVLKVHECLVPYLIRKEPISGGNLTKEEVALTLTELNERPPIVEAPHTIWLKDIDIWYSFPESWLAVLLPQIPEACFFKNYRDV